MSWAHGKLPSGEEVGYAVPGTCEHPGCAASIDKGLAHVCGGMHEGGEHGCGRYFCPRHLTFAVNPVTGYIIRDAGQVCMKCCETLEEVPA